MKPPARKAQKAGAAESAIDLAVSSAKAAPAATGRAARTATRGPARAAQDSAPEQPTANRARGASVNSARRKRRPSALSSTEDDIDASAADSPATCTNANHNKYCHFCQHVKVRASSMLACENQECCRRFCEHCLLTHLNENVDPMSSDAWTLVDGKPFWNCPICRKKCCCSVPQCTENHRHCKAYRYRRRRAELATKRQSAAASHAQAEKRNKKSSPTRAPVAAKVSHVTPTLARPTLSFGFVRSSAAAAQLDSPPMMRAGSITSVPGFGEVAPAGARPRREAALKRRRYDLDGGTDEEDQGENSQGDDDDEITTPGIEGASPILAHEPPQGEPRVHHHHVAPHHFHQEVPAPSDAHHADVGCSAPPSAPSTAPSAGLWSHEEGPGQHHAMASEMGGYRSDEEADNLMLGGIYGHMTEHNNAPSMISAADMRCPEMLIDDVHIGSAELEEARWLRRTYETVYNPAARQRALQALSGDFAKHQAASSSMGRPQEAPPGMASVPPTGPSSNDEGMWKVQAGQGWGQPKAPWGASGGAKGHPSVGKCHVTYEMV